jgi:cellobiose-specific phosphotransferase system component IIC
MAQPQRIVRERRQYNQWVATQTLEDYALRYTADRARMSSFRVGNTAFGPIAFLACEAIGGALTISYGFSNAASAIVFFSMLMFVIGMPIAYYAAKFGVDIDLLTRGAGLHGFDHHVAHLCVVYVFVVRHRSQHHVDGVDDDVRYSAVAGAFD